MESSPFKGGVRAPALNNPHPIIAYAWQKQLIAVDLGDRGDIQAARWQLEVWLEKISSELGYAVVFAALVHPDAKGFVGEMLNALAKRTDLDPIWLKEKDWKP